MVHPEEGRLFVFSGPSGVGKDAVLSAYKEAEPNTLYQCVTLTTRDPRPGEVDGVDYHFKSIDEFRKMAANGELLEWAEVHGHYYATPLSSVKSFQKAGKDVVLKIDVQGAMAVKEKLPEAILLFVAPPSLEVLEERLRGRNTEEESDIERRLENALTELSYIPRYDYLIVNNTIEQAVRLLGSILQAEHSRISPK